MSVAERMTGADGPEAAGEHTALLAAKRLLESSPAGVREKLALAEACFRLAVRPGVGIDEALELMKEATAHDPYHPKLFFHLGRLRLSDGDPRAAVLDYRRALRLAPQSHRTLVHLAMALNDLDQEDRELGLRILGALAAGDGGATGGLIAQVDERVARWAISEAGKPTPAAAGTEETPQSGGAGCRWRGLWKLFLLKELSRPKPSPKRTSEHLDSGRDAVGNQRGWAEYVTACLLFVLDGRALCRQIEARLAAPKLAAYQDRPALQLARTVCGLGAAEKPEQFVERAAAALEARQIPPELVCCLHYCWYGQAPNVDAVEAVALIDRYPEAERAAPCFRELRIAILDHHARLAWLSERFDRAEILWQESFAADPTRAAVAHNLALAATRRKAEDKYAAAWDRAAELRYLLAAGAGDPRVALEDRQFLHRSFAQQARLRHIQTAEGARGGPPEKELRPWMEDGDAFAVWLREWELSYLNARLRFQSPLHLLGLGLDCSDEDAEAGRAALSRQFGLCFRDRRWAGAEVFRHLVEEHAAQACTRAKEPVQRKRDPHFESEKEAAALLEKEAIERGFLLYTTLCIAGDWSSAKAKRSGLEAAAYLLNMPWRLLERTCKRTGVVSADKNLLEVFASHAAGLVQDAGAGPPERRLEIARRCLEGAPEAHQLRLVQCVLLVDSKCYREAYDSALAGLALLSGRRQEADAARLEGKYSTVVDNAALMQIPANLRRPSPSQAAAFASEARRVLGEYPKAGGLRLLLAELLIRASDSEPSRLAEASAVLQEGLDQFLTDEQMREARQLMERAGAKSEAAEALSRVRKLLESAADRARKAVETWRGDRSASVTRQSIEQLEQAVEESAQAEEIASGAKLEAAAARARSLREDLGRLREEIGRG